MQKHNSSPYFRRNSISSQLSSVRLWRQSHRLILSEAGWGSCACLLFLIAGPFSAPVVLLALAHLARKAQEEGGREPICL
ncbi:MAG: hypothetical protein Q4G66_06095 [bacterium]|nr:hypothetical protein [bacterium]